MPKKAKKASKETKQKGDKGKKSKQRRTESYSVYIYKVLKQVMNEFMIDMPLVEMPVSGCTCLSTL